MNARTPIVKMSGAGNDFIVLAATEWEGLEGDRARWVRDVCRRGLSVGADGVLVVAPAAEGRIRVTFFNPDAGEAFCGNGSRCAARYAVARGLAAGPAMILVTSVGEVPARVDGATVTLRLPPPENRGSIDLRGPDGTVTGRLIVAGVPHFVLHVEEITAWPLAAVAPTLRRDPALGREGANVDVVARDRAGRVHVRTFERGVEGETLACGTGAVAAAYDARIDGASGRIDVVPASGVPLTVELPGDPLRPEAAILTGDARFIFEGVLAPDGLAGTS